MDTAVVVEDTVDGTTEVTEEEEDTVGAEDIMEVTEEEEDTVDGRMARE